MDASIATSPQAGIDHVDVDGWVHHSLQLNASALAAYGPIAIADFLVVCTLDGAHGRSQPLRGVPLPRLVEAAAPAFGQRTDFKRVAIIAHSREGYRALFSWNELFNTAVGDGVLVAWDGPEVPLPERAGPFALVSLRDRATGPRYVQRLARVEVCKLW